MAKYTIEQAKELYSEAVRLKLLRADNLFDPVRVSNVCNGIGAEWMPDFMRRTADALYPVMGPPAAIHDVDYDGGGDESDRLAADLVFHANCLIAIEAKYAWYHPSRYLMQLKADRFYKYLRTFGALAFHYDGEKAK